MAVTVTPDGRRAVSTSWDGTLRIWDLESGQTLGTLSIWDLGSGKTLPMLESLRVTPDGRRAMSASEDGTLVLWDLESGQILCTTGGRGGRLSPLAAIVRARCTPYR